MVDNSECIEAGEIVQWLKYDEYLRNLDAINIILINNLKDYHRVAGCPL